jgi:hypothetical protein
MGLMTKEIDLDVYFCPECKDVRIQTLPFCSKCGARIRKASIIVCMQDNQSPIERILLKGDS